MENLSKRVRGWTEGVPIDETALQQLNDVAQLPFIFKHIAVMPDVHAGMGATIGSVIPTKGAIIPAAVGVDIGCGMIAQKTDVTRDDMKGVNLRLLRYNIECAVPHGRSDGSEKDIGSWKRVVPEHIERCYNEFLRDKLDALLNYHPKLGGVVTPQIQAINMLGTLGTGNHFIELCFDENDYVWAMLHSGSRGIGNRIGTYFISKAKEEMKKWFIDTPNKDLAYIPEHTHLFSDYWLGINWAQHYAKMSRQFMMDEVIRELSRMFPSSMTVGYPIDCHHNYASKEHHYGENVIVTRKGAICARAGQLGIIPGSMGAKSYIVQGLGCKESFTSSAHGAGRTMSRREAREKITVDQHVKATQGVECNKGKEVLDDSPAAYKNIDVVMEAQKELVETVHELKQFICIKG